MKINQIQIKHPLLGDIVINGYIEKEISEQIGDVITDYSKSPEYYHAEIIKNEDGTFFIRNLSVIKPESINIGWMDNSKGQKNFITVITNRFAGDNIVVYPSAVLSVTYN